MAQEVRRAGRENEQGSQCSGAPGRYFRPGWGTGTPSATPFPPASASRGAPEAGGEDGTKPDQHCGCRLRHFGNFSDRERVDPEVGPVELQEPAPEQRVLDDQAVQAIPEPERQISLESPGWRQVAPQFECPATPLLGSVG